MKRLFFALFALIMAMTVFVSCGGPKPANDTDTKKGMSPTEEYNYLLSPEGIEANLKSYMGSEELANEPSVSEAITQMGYSNPEVHGFSDGNLIKVEAVYPALPEKLAYAKLLSDIPVPSRTFDGYLKPEDIIGFIVLPGPQKIFDTASAYIDLNNQAKPEVEGESQGMGMLGKNYNPMTQATGLAMVAGISLQDDLFSWMGTEMGMLFYIANDAKNVPYMNTAFALSTGNKATAVEKMHKLLGLLPKYIGNPDISTILETTENNGLTVDLINLETLGMADYAQSMFGEMKKIGILYTDDWVFFSDDYGINQLSSKLTKATATPAEGHINFRIGMNDFAKNSQRYQKDFIDQMRSEMYLDPEVQKLIEEKIAELQKKLDSGDFGTSSLSVKFNPDGIKMTLNTTKVTIEFMNSVHDTITEIQKLEGSITEQSEVEEPESEESEGMEPETEEPEAETPETEGEVNT
jgi:hypothetical protein